MKTAIRALGYPKPNPKKLSCKGLGTADTSARFVSFRCVATYAHNRRRRFYTAGRGEGGWLCTSKLLAGCTTAPRRGFVTTAAASTYPSFSGAAQIAAEGYLADHDQFPYQVVHFCLQVGMKAGTSAWSCAFTVDGSPVSVSLSFRTAKGGYVISGDTAS